SGACVAECADDEGPPREGRPTGAAVEAGEVDLGGTCLRAARARLVANNAPARVQRGSETGCGPGAGAPVAYGNGGSPAPADWRAVLSWPPRRAFPAPCAVYADGWHCVHFRASAAGVAAGNGRRAAVRAAARRRVARICGLAARRRLRRPRPAPARRAFPGR